MARNRRIYQSVRRVIEGDFVTVIAWIDMDSVAVVAVSPYEDGGIVLDPLRRGSMSRTVHSYHRLSPPHSS
jgi:hypothetical protein